MRRAFVLIALATLVAGQTPTASVTHEIPLAYNPATNALAPADPSKLPVIATNGDEVSMELTTPHAFPLPVRRLAYKFHYKTKYEKRRGGIFGIFGGKTTVINDHWVWVFADVNANSLGEKGEIAIKIEVPKEEPFFPSTPAMAHTIEQVKKGGGPIGVGGTVTKTADAYNRALETVLRDHVNPEHGYDLKCENQTSPEITEAGGASKPLANPADTLTAPPPLQFTAKIIVKGSQ